MKYQPRQMGDAAEVSAGGGRRGTWRELLTLLLLSAAAMIVIWLAFGGLAALAVSFITPQKESALFSGVTPDFKHWQPADPADLARRELLDQVLEKMTAHPDVPQIPYQIRLIDDETPNAFAIPGGVIGITRGLLDALGDEEVAYAFVIGHELGHFKHRDHLRGMVRKLGTGATVGLVFGSGGAASLAGNTNELLNLGYSRDQEEAADAFGLRLVEATYGKTAGSERLFEKIQESQALPSWAYMFSTHPDTRDRLRKLRESTR